MHRIYNLVRTEITPFNMPETPEAEVSLLAKQKCIEIAKHITAKASDVANQRYLQNPLHFLTIAEVVMSTHHRHCRFLGQQCHDARLTFGAEFIEILMRLSNLSNHPPRGSHWTMWLDIQADKPVMYTGHRDELRFGLLVRDTDSVMRQLADYGTAIATGQASFRDPIVRQRLSELGHDIEGLHKAYFALACHDAAQKPDYDDRWFLHFRQFLAPMEICQRIVPGPNPAHVASWPEADILFGLSDQIYLESVRERYSSYLGTEIFRLERAMAIPTVPKILEGEMRDESLNASEREIIVDLFHTLVKRLKAISGVHWSAIVKHLKKPQQKMAKQQNTSLLLSAEAGVSGRDLRETEQLLEIRRSKNPAQLFLDQHLVRRKEIA